MNKLLVVVDYQNDFVTGALANTAAVPLESGIAALVKQTLAEGGRVLFTRDTHSTGYLHTREGEYLPVPHCIKGTDGWHLYGALAEYEAGSSESVAVADKPTFGSYSLPGEAQALCGGAPDEIHLCGVVTDICVLSNAVMLHSAFLQAGIFIHAGLCAGLTPEGHTKALDIMRGLGYHIV